MLNEGSKTIRVEYVDYSKKSGIKGYCDEESELKEFDVKGSSQYVVHEIGEFGQNLLELDGPVSVDDIFARPVISIREPSIYARVAQPTTTPSPSPSPSPQHKECFSVTSQSFSCDLVAGAGADECDFSPGLCGSTTSTPTLLHRLRRQLLHYINGYLDFRIAYNLSYVK